MEGEELNNPMKVLKNQTKDSELEMEVLKNLQGLKKLNQKQADLDFWCCGSTTCTRRRGKARG